MLNYLRSLVGVSIFNPKSVFLVLFVVNLLNYCDRGIIPGSTNEFSQFVSSSLQTDTPDVYIGLLQSSFIIGFAVASIIFGHLVHFYSPFFLCGIGMSIWCIAVISSGIALQSNSYGFLVFARCLSGVGESSMQCSIPPWIESHAGAGAKASWLGLFYSAIPVGTAIGYTYSAVISSSIGAKYAFYIEFFMMAPFIIFLFLASLRYPEIASSSSANSCSPAVKSKSVTGGDGNELVIDEPPPTLFEELHSVFSSSIFICLVLGYAAQTGSLIGISTFGSPLLMGLGYFETETEASTTFGVLVSVAGVIGSLGGGLILDARAKHSAREYAEQRAVETGALSIVDQEDAGVAVEVGLGSIELVINSLYLKQACAMVWVCSVCGSLCLWSAFVLYDKVAFLLVVGLGCTFIFFTTPGINLAIMQAVSQKNRSFAIAICNLLIHALGDVPSPIIAGLLKDKLAPNCSGVDAASDQCRADNMGLRWTFFFVNLWLGWAVIFFGFALILAGRSLMKRQRENALREDRISVSYSPLPSSSTHGFPPLSAVLSEPLLPAADSTEEKDRVRQDDANTTYVL